MSRHKSGLDYFSFDIDFFNDEKIEFTSARFGIQGEIITIKLLCKIYRNGYYLKWGGDECLLFSKRVGEGITVELINDVIKELLKREFFNEQIFEEYQVLTSRGIQKRYLEAVKRRKEVTIYKEYFLLNKHNADIVGRNVNIISRNVDISKQSKVKESKVKNNTNTKDVSSQFSQGTKKEKKKANNIEFDFELWAWFGIDDDIRDRWAEIFPNVDVEIELNKIRVYFKKHPGHEKIIKTKFNDNYANYIFDWLVRAEGYNKERKEKK